MAIPLISLQYGFISCKRELSLSKSYYIRGMQAAGDDDGEEQVGKERASGI